MSESNTTKTVTPKARIAFAQLFEAKSFDGNPAKFGCTLIFDKEAQASPEFKKMKELASNSAKEKWGDKLPATMRSPFRSSSEKEGMAGFDEGTVFINVSSKNQPRVVDKNKVNGAFPLIQDASKVYSGAYVRASVNAYAYDQKGNKGVAFGLNNVQFLTDGERLGGGQTNPNDEFENAGGDNITDVSEDAGSVF